MRTALLLEDYTRLMFWYFHRNAQIPQESDQSQSSITAQVLRNDCSTAETTTHTLTGCSFTSIQDLLRNPRIYRKSEPKKGERKYFTWCTACCIIPGTAEMKFSAELYSQNVHEGTLTVSYCYSTYIRHSRSSHIHPQQSSISANNSIDGKEESHFWSKNHVQNKTTPVAL